MKLNYGYIYKITNLINNKIYIGQTICSLKRRWNKHIHDGGCVYLHSAILKYGKENFKMEEIEYVLKEQLDEREIYWIKYYNSTNKEVGYNLLPGGKLGRKEKYRLTPEQTQEIIKLDEQGVTHTKIGKMFGINRKTVTFILRRETNYTSKYKSLKQRDDLDEIKNFLKTNPTVKEVKDKFKISQSTLFKLTKQWGYKFLTYQERLRNQEYNSSKSVQTPPSNVEG